MASPDEPVLVTLFVHTISLRGALLLRLPDGLSSDTKWVRPSDVTHVTDAPLVEGVTRTFRMRRAVAVFNGWVGE
jgi:hypothetical protein